MSTKEVFALRKQGKLSEAYKMAKAQISEVPDDAWCVRALAWVLIDMIKSRLLDQRSVENLYAELANLTLPADDHVLREQVGWVICKMLFKLPKDQNSSRQISNLLHGYAKLNVERPSLLHSAILGAVLTHAEHFEKTLEFVKWWDVRCFRDEDYKTETNDKGDEYPSEYVKAMRFLGKAGKKHPQLSEEMIGWLLATLKDAIERCPEEEWFPYYHGQLLIRSGNVEQATNELLPVIRRKKSQFWAWDLLAHLCSDLAEKRMCLCRALTCRTPDHSFLVNVHLELADVFWALDQNKEAQGELAQVIEVRKQKDWSVPRHLHEKAQAYGVDETTPKLDAKRYREFAKNADALLCKDVPEVIGVVSHVNADKKLSCVLFDKDKAAFVLVWHKSFPEFAAMKEGTVVALKLGYDDQHKRHLLLQSGLSEEQPDKTFCKSVAGEVRRGDSQSFAFLNDDTFIPPFLVEQKGIENGMQVPCMQNS